jgi:hypothetical protein
MKKHIFYYLGLVAMILIAILFILQVAANKQLEMVIVVGFGIVYAFWGIMHHYLHHSLRARIVLEYVAVASLGVAAILFLVKAFI